SMPLPEHPPGRAWLAANYGFAASAGLALTLAHALPGPAVSPTETLARFCALPLGLLCLWEGWRTARPGAWGPEGAIEMRQPDVALVAWGLLSAVAASLALAAAGQLPFGLVVLDVGTALQAFSHRLWPELGRLGCCRRALAVLVRVRQVPGAAIILRDGEAIAHGDFDLAPLVRVWPRGAAADALPARSFGTIELRALPLALREALVRAHVTLGAGPILRDRKSVV